MNNSEQINLLTNELALMRERYLKLADIHGQLQMQNSLLEERVLSIVETYSNEKNHLEQSLFDAKQEILCLKETINDLQIEKQRYKDDCNLAVRLLHRHPNEFISTTSGQIQEQIKNRFDSTSANQFISSQRSVLIPTFPPTFVAPPPLLTTTTMPAFNNTQTISATSTTNDSLRLAAEALFKSNSVHRSPSTQFICSDCHQIVKRCDVGVQTSLDNNTNHNITSRLRLVSLTSSDDGLSNDDAWVSFDSQLTGQRYQMNHTRQALKNEGHNELSTCSIPKMHHEDEQTPQVRLLIEK
ncbi:unnamed protein product [Rotaria sp. Silwood1]|nr:unnamed protein product [Rotaria sp. Silwood1]CAF1108536.1 unnamed protein product [Rotaria sp. Silwood1]